MRRSLVSLSLVVLVAVGLSGCDATITPAAAKVGSTTITSAKLNDSLAAIADDKGFLCTLAQANPSAAISINSIKGAGSGTFNSSFAASQLSLLIREKVLSTMLSRIGVSATAYQIELATNRLSAELNPSTQSTCNVAGGQIVSSLPSSYREFLVAVEVEQDLLAAHLVGAQLTSAGLAAFSAAHQRAAYDVCVSAILVATRSAAVAARARIEAGASFASVAKTTSTDQTSAGAGGALGCLPTSQFQHPLDADLQRLAVGTVSQPISFSGSYVLLVVTSRKQPSDIEALNYLLGSANAAETAAVNSNAARLSVRVDPKYGTWKKVNGSFEVVPPVGPALRDLANPSAITPPTLPLG